jgi:protein-tyrosine phosphatase
MIVEVKSRAKATEFSFEAHNEKIAVISISDVDKESPVFSTDSTNGIFRCAKFHFADVELDGENCITDEQATEIAAFVFEIHNTAERIIVHCEAGVSRSAGVAGAIMKYLNDNDWPVFDNPKYCPNRTCYRKVLEALHEYEIKQSEVS